MLEDQKADDKTCDWVAKDDYRNWGSGGQLLLFTS